MSTCLLLAACAPAPAPLVSPDWQAIPSGVIDVVCTRMRDDGVTDVAVVKTTQRIATPEALGTLGAAYGQHTTNERATAALATGQRSLPVEAKSRVCAVTPIERMDGQRYADAMVLELSPPIANPFARNEAGLFARVSLGGQHPTWYWVPLGNSGGMWAVGQALPLH